MSENGSLGIYLSKDKAVAVWLAAAGSPPAILNKLAIPLSDEEPATMALQAARAVRRQGFAFDEAFVAVDCGYYTQYKLQSEFDDISQIQSTIKFDVEEAAATDAMNLAVAFEMTGKTQHGAEVAAFTADRQLMTDILMDVQEGGLDPAFIEPDSVCLVRGLSAGGTLTGQTGVVYIILGRTGCYLFRPQAEFAPVVRTFLIERTDLTTALVRETLLGAGTAGQPPTSLVLIGLTEGVDTEMLAQRTGLEVRIESPAAALDPAWTPDGGIPAHELLIAYGAGLAPVTRGHKPDFRQDFMPFQGRKKVLEKSLRLIGISLTVMLLSVAVFFQIKTFRMKGYAGEIHEKALAEHRSVTFGKLPIRGMSVTSSLKREYTQAKDSESGMTAGGDKSVPAKLTYFFEALNKTPKNVDINLQQITVSERVMKIKGDTNSRPSTLAFFEQIKKDPRLKLASEQVASGAENRDVFDINIEPAE